MSIGITQTSVLIANGASLSGAVPVGDRVPVGIAMPAAWDGTSLTFQVSVDGGASWCELTDSGGTAISATVAPSRYIPLDPTVWIGINMIKIRSGTSGAPTNQTADHSLTLVSRY